MKGRVAVNKSLSWDEQLKVGREAFNRQEWSLAYSELRVADIEKPLDPEDLACLAKAAYILGRDLEGSEILAKAHRNFLDQGEILPAIRCAFWLGFSLLLRNDRAQAGGWLSRAARLLEGHDDCVERGYLLLPDGFRQVRDGDAAVGYELFHQAAEIGVRFNDNDLVTFGLNGQGRALIRLGQIERGVALLDEAMVAVTAGEVSTLVAGGVYCSVIEACSDIYDLRRAQEWTEALERWCNSQPGQISYRGHCMLRRAEILQLHGEWQEAISEARLACERFTEPSQMREMGAAIYRLAELHRLRGELDKAEDLYRQASQLGANAQPGLAQLRLLQGQTEAARGAIRPLMQESRDIKFHANVLDACVEIMLAAGDLKTAHESADELARIAMVLNAPLLNAISDRAAGAMLLAENEFDQALVVLRRSIDVFRDVDTPYEEARSRILIAKACQMRKDFDTAELELQAARLIFNNIGAMPDMEQVDTLLYNLKPNGSGPLTRRESEVLKLVASGMTNREIASKLFISEKTVARHLSNIFDKLDLPSRAAATAYAYEHHFVSSTSSST